MASKLEFQEGSSDVFSRSERVARLRLDATDTSLGGRCLSMSPDRLVEILHESGNLGRENRVVRIEMTVGSIRFYLERKESGNAEVGGR